MSLLRAPAYLSYEEMSCFPKIVGVTAWNALLDGGTPLLAGQAALLRGTCGVSNFGLQVAYAARAEICRKRLMITIIVSSSDEKLKLAKKLLATHAINNKKAPD
ncbi:hypothetical protein K488DRAFT_70491 [Vararia minispora EC-137]|uniref:Uncharacterized protein n=1 Tax=Vararia minispora EC-137 TaxID=1314806 RepID=A0ACB8QLB3_9AGAM|nr:hypothetical protein K488DRAFT_70491 [Vararia minispora EC-137]